HSTVEKAAPARGRRGVRHPEGRASTARNVETQPGLLRRGSAGALAAAPIGAAAAIVTEDLGERTMLGDTGAHALGAALGTAIVAGNGRAGLALHAAALIAAVAYGDEVSRIAGSPM
ncbi:hypothetical protein AB0F96_32580, partial [Streptomyces sp. NPDC023998]